MGIRTYIKLEQANVHCSLPTSEKNMLTCCHVYLDRLTHWTFTFYLVVNTNFCVRTISVYMANKWTIQIRDSGIAQSLKMLLLLQQASDSASDHNAI